MSNSPHCSLIGTGESLGVFLLSLPLTLKIYPYSSYISNQYYLNKLVVCTHRPGFTGREGQKMKKRGQVFYLIEEYLDFKLFEKFFQLIWELNFVFVPGKYLSTIDTAVHRMMKSSFISNSYTLHASIIT